MLSHLAPRTIRNCVFTLEKTRAKKQRGAQTLRAAGSQAEGGVEWGADLPLLNR